MRSRGARRDLRCRMAKAPVSLSLLLCRFRRKDHGPGPYQMQLVPKIRLKSHCAGEMLMCSLAAGQWPLGLNQQDSLLLLIANYGYFKDRQRRRTTAR